MKQVNIHEAKTNLSNLIADAENGEEIIIARAGKPVVRLTAIPRKRKKRRPGGWEGKVWIADDFDELPEDVAAAFRGERP